MRNQAKNLFDDEATVLMPSTTVDLDATVISGNFGNSTPPDLTVVENMASVENAAAIANIVSLEKSAAIESISLEEDFQHFALASVQQRVLAVLLDGLFVAVLVGVVRALVAILLDPQTNEGLFTFISNFVALTYFILMQYNDGQTLGKKIIKIKVISESSGDLMSFGQVLGRETVGRWLSGIPLCLGYITASRREDRKTWHDRMFKTRVVSFRA